jgi:hypothetical protein
MNRRELLLMLAGAEPLRAAEGDAGNRRRWAER